MIDSSACIHRILDGNINEFVFTEISRRAIDELFDIIETLQIEAARTNPADHYKPALVDSRLGIQPLNYAFKRMQSVTTKYPAMRRARVAIIVPPTPLLTTIATIMRPISLVHFYKATEREQALAWLIQAHTLSPSRQPETGRVPHTS